MRRKCPICRAMIPPSKEMVTTLLTWRARKQELEDDNETSSVLYQQACQFLKEAEENVGADWDGVTVLQDDNDEPAVTMPNYIYKAAAGHANKSTWPHTWTPPPPAMLPPVTDKTCGICLEDSKDPLDLPADTRSATVAWVNGGRATVSRRI